VFPGFLADPRRTGKRGSEVTATCTRHAAGEQNAGKSERREEADAALKDSESLLNSVCSMLKWNDSE